MGVGVDDVVMVGGVCREGVGDGVSSASSAGNVEGASDDGPYNGDSERTAKLAGRGLQPPPPMPAW